MTTQKPTRPQVRLCTRCPEPATHTVILHGYNRQHDSCRAHLAEVTAALTPVPEVIELLPPGWNAT